MPHHTATKGNIGVAMATVDLLEKGWDVFTPVCPTSPIDLVAYRDGSLLRIQVKYRAPQNGALRATTDRHSVSAGKYSRSLANSHVDVLCIYNAGDHKCYYVPASLRRVVLRLKPTVNGQRKGVLYAVDFLKLPPSPVV